MEEISSEEMIGHAPDASRELASHLRAGVLSLPGVKERCFGDEAAGTYYAAFAFDDDPILQAFMEDPLRVTLEMRDHEAEAMVGRADLARAKYQQSGETDRRPLAEIIETAQGTTVGLAAIELVVTSEEDMLAAVRLAHAKYDALMTG